MSDLLSLVYDGGKHVSIATEAASGFTQYDTGVRAISAVSARLAYVFMCLTLCWGIFTATGWVQKASGHEALRSSHMMLAAATLATAVTHVLAFELLDNNLPLVELLVPFADHTFRHAVGIIALWLFVVITGTAGLHRLFRYANWLRLHQTAYIAVGLAATHSWIGAYVNGHLSVIWLGGVTFAVPTLTLAALRVVPPRFLVGAGLLDRELVGDVRGLDRSLPMAVSVDNQRCHRYAFCQAEAPEVFQLREDGLLQYRELPPVEYNAEVRSAARACPMRAIELTGVDL